LVCGDFRLPKRSVALGVKVPSAIVAMPKATVDEDHHSGFAPNEIGFSWQLSLSLPSRHAVLSQEAYQALLRGLVTRTPYARHQL
jgi:hypothetical protein